MGDHARDVSGTIGIGSRSASWFRVALDVLPGLLEPVTPSGVSSALALGAVRHFACACALDCLDPVVGMRRVAFAWDGTSAAPTQCRWPPTNLPRGLRAQRPSLLSGEASAQLFPSVRGGNVLAVPLEIDAAPYGYLWLLARAGEDFGESDLAIGAELGHWTESALARAQVIDAMARSAERQRELSALVEHELRSPLGTLIGWVRLLANEPGAASERISRGLAAIERGGRSMTRVVEDWHEASRMLLGGVAIDPRPLSLAGLVRRIVEARRAMIEPSGTTLSLDVDEEATAAVDERRVREMVERMLDRVERSTPLAGRIAVRVALHGQAVVIVVEGQTREGAPQSVELERGGEAEAGSRLSDRTLTLAVVRGIAELHGGSAGAERAGSSFTSRIWALLPRGGRAPASAETEPQSERADLHGVHVLLVDDARDSLELAATIVRLRGAQAALATSSSEAIELLRTLPIDVLVSDIAMPFEDGCSLVRRALEIRPSLRAAALSAHAHVEDRERALAAGFETYLTKPIDPDTLALVIRSLAHPVPVRPAGAGGWR